MVLLEVKLIAESFGTTEVRRLMRDLTEATVKVGGEELRPHITVVVDEIGSHRWAEGGYPLAADDVRALRESVSRAGGPESERSADG